jgi:hypothetical protein
VTVEHDAWQSAQRVADVIAELCDTLPAGSAERSAAFTVYSLVLLQVDAAWEAYRATWDESIPTIVGAL